MELAIGTYVVFLEADNLNEEVKRGTLGVISEQERREDDGTIERYGVTCFDADMNQPVADYYYKESFLPIDIKPKSLVKAQQECDCECFGNRHRFEDGSLCPCVCHD